MATCEAWVSSFYNDDDISPCYQPATAEVFTTAGQWQPYCPRHAQGYPDSRLRELGETDG